MMRNLALLAGSEIMDTKSSRYGQHTHAHEHLGNVFFIDKSVIVPVEDLERLSNLPHLIGRQFGYDIGARMTSRPRPAFKNRRYMTGQLRSLGGGGWELPSELGLRYGILSRGDRFAVSSSVRLI